MSVAINIARAGLTLITAAISVFFMAASPAIAKVMHIDVKEGDTSFVIDTDHGIISWVKQECLYEIPISKDKKAPRKPTNIVFSERFSQNVQIGSHLTW